MPDPHPSLSEARAAFVGRYLAELFRRYPKPAEAARIAGTTRQHLYKLAARHGVPCGHRKGSGRSSAYEPLERVTNPVATSFLTRRGAARDLLRLGGAPTIPRA